MSLVLYHCKKCGHQPALLHSYDKKCSICGAKLYETPHEYIDNFRWRDGDGKQAVIEELVKPSPEFDQYLFDHRDEIRNKQKEEFNNMMEVGKALREGKKVSKQELLSGKLNDSTKYNSPQCPTCKSFRVKKISGAERAGSIFMFGVRSKKINKSFKCTNCGYTW